MSTVDKLCDFLSDLAMDLQRNGAHGLMLVQIPGRDLPKRKWQGYQKEYVQLQSLSYDGIPEFISRFRALVTRKSHSYMDGKTDMRLANWFFTEYTPKTRNLKSNTKFVGKTDFYGQEKHFLYFDMDIKDQLGKHAFESMTEEEKKKYVFVDCKKAIDYIESTEPYYITFTGNGLHFGYIVEGIPIPRKGEDVYADGYKKLMYKLSKNTGWKFDEACSSLQRIDRLPFTFNVKTNNPSEDTFAESHTLSCQPSGTFVAPLRERMGSAEVKNLMTRKASEITIYDTFGIFREYSPKVYKYIRENLTFSELFNYFHCADRLGYKQPDDADEHFQSCFSPFRTPIFDKVSVTDSESIPSFRYDESTGKWYDFGKVPFAGSGVKGDVGGLAYSMWYAQENGTFPPRLDEIKAMEICTNIIGGKSIEEIRAETTVFQRDENNRILADFSTTAQVVMDELVKRYEIVYAIDQKHLMFREWNSVDNMKLFPHETYEFGGKKQDTIGRAMLDIAGVSNPPKDLQKTATQVVDVIMDSKGFKYDRKEGVAYMDHPAFDRYKFPTMDSAYTVLKFKNNVYYHIVGGKCTSSYDRFAYHVDCDYVPFDDPIETPYWDMLLTNIAGKKNSPEWMALQFIFAQMWIPAYGDSRALLIQGFGRNGKSTFTDVLKGILPRGITMSSKMEALTNNDGSSAAQRMEIMGKRLVIVPDLTEYTMPTELKGLITGDDDITAKYLYRNPVKFSNTASLVMMTNSIPYIVDDVFAFLRRFILITVPKTVKRVIPDIAQRIIEDEITGVWQYIVKSIEYFRKYNFVFPEHEDWAQEIIVPMKRTLINRMNVGEYIVNLTPVPGANTSLRELYASFKEHAMSTGLRCPSYKSFTEKVVSIVQTDVSIFTGDWSAVFKDAGMEEGVYIVYRNGQAEVLGNIKFSPPEQMRVQPVKPFGIDRLIKAYFRPDDRFHSVRYPDSTTVDVLQRLKQFSMSRPANSNVLDYNDQPDNEPVPPVDADEDFDVAFK